MFCNNCGSQIEEGTAFCPNCGAATNPAPAADPVVETPVYQAPVANTTVSGTSNGMATAALVCGIFSLVIGVIGSIMFGVWSAAVALVLGIVAVVLGTNAKKTTNNDSKASAGFICGLIGLIVSVFFAIGCAVCGACTAGYYCHGCVGGACKAQSDVKGAYNELEDLLNSYDWY